MNYKNKRELTKKEILNIYKNNEKDLSYLNLKEVDLNNANLNDANLSYANLNDANLSYADLRHTNLTGADLNNTNLDFSTGFSLSCKGLNVKIDEKILFQYLYHLNSNTQHLELNDDLREVLKKYGNKSHILKKHGLKDL